jgi:heterodisulfide reductase subunit A-like polyferredoxin
VEPEFTVDDLDLGEDASPEIVKAFKTLGARSQKAIQAATAQAVAAQAAAANTAVQYQNQVNQANANQQAEVSARAVSYLDNLASPKYGVGTQRTMVQTLASEQVMQTAGNLIRGMQNYGQVLPIEQVMSAAILMVDGNVPQAPAAATPTQGGLTPTPPKGVATPVKTKQIGSSGAAQQMMGDAEFMEGARAIMSR